MSVTAAPDRPGPKLFVGVVRDTNLFLIEGAEITIPSLQRRTFSKDDGTFRFDNIGRGTYKVRARKLGYAPQVREFKVEGDGGTASFELLPTPYALPVVISSAVRGGLSGVVADTAYEPVPDAEVTVLTKYLNAFTDSSGRFFIPAPPGNYMISVKKDGYATRVSGVTVPVDSGRNMTVSLLPARPVPVQEYWNLADFQARQAMRSAMKEPFYTREDILKLGITWIFDLVRMGGMDQYDSNCAVIVNGGPGTTSLSILTVDDVEAVEIFGGNRFSRPQSAVTGLQNISQKARPSNGVSKSITNTGPAARLNENKRCPIVYVWLR